MKPFSFQMPDLGKCKNQPKGNCDKKIIEGILQNSNKVMTSVYKQNFVKIKKMVGSFKNTTLDPEDVFHEGFSRAIVNIREGKFRGESSFSTYLNGICKNICMKQLSKKKTYELSLNYEIADDENHFELLEMVLQVRKRMDRKCRTIVDLRFDLNESSNNEGLTTFEEIAEKLNLSVVNARQRFSRCLAKLRELVGSSPEINEYFT